MSRFRLLLYPYMGQAPLSIPTLAVGTRPARKSSVNPRLAFVHRPGAPPQGGLARAVLASGRDLVGREVLAACRRVRSRSSLLAVFPTVEGFPRRAELRQSFLVPGVGRLCRPALTRRNVG
jgi:hypothetical protein